MEKLILHAQRLTCTLNQGLLFLKITVKTGMFKIISKYSHSLNVMECIFRISGFSRSNLEGVEWNMGKHPNGKYSIMTKSLALVDELQAGSLIHCEIRIPGTGYVRKESLLYYPEVDNSDACQSVLSVKEMVVFCAVINFIKMINVI